MVNGITGGSFRGGTNLRMNAPKTRGAAQKVLSQFFREVSIHSEHYLTPRIHLCNKHYRSFGGWIDALADGVIKKGSLLVHVDAHNDLAVANDVHIPESFFMYPQGVERIRLIEDGREFVLRLSHTELHPEASFVVPALAMGLFNQMIHIVEIPGEHRNGRIHFEMDNFSDRKYLSSSRISVGDIGSQGIKWGAANMELFQLFQDEIKEFQGLTVLDLDLDFFNFVEGDLQKAALNFCHLVMRPLMPSFMTVALSRDYTRYDLAKQPGILMSILDFCFENSMLVE